MAFWQVAFVLSLVAAAFVLWPLAKFPFMRKQWAGPAAYDETQVALYNEHLADLEKARLAGDIDEAQLQELKLELQKTLVTERVTAEPHKLQTGGKLVVVVMAVVVPLLAVFLYSSHGSKPDWEIYQVLEELPRVTTQEEYSNKMRELVVKVQARLQQTPDNLQLRNLMAQTSMALQDYDQAVNAYKKILEQVPDSPRVIANLAQAMFYRAGNVVTPEVREYTQQALALAPMLPEMLGLAGIDAKSQGDYRGAIRYWKMAVSQMDPNSQAAKGYLSGIAKAEQALASSREAAGTKTPEAGEKQAGPSIKVLVSLDKAVKVQPDTTVFVYARAWKGAKMPLAIKRLTVADLPAAVVLDESMAMAPGMTITSFPELEVVARVSRAGSPAPQSGDWQAAQGPVKLSHQDETIRLEIDEQIP